MKIADLAKNLWLPCGMLVLFMVAITFRPLLPVDETRYMSVAWEMFLRHGWFQPLTVNFAPYHHKPPFLFWLINLSWSVLGVSRWAGLIPTVMFSLLCVYLTGFLGKRLFPEKHNSQRIWLIMFGSMPFMIYGTLVMFDFMLCMFILLSFICLYYFRQERRLHCAVLMGLCLGFGVLTKGPVAYLYVLPVALLAPFWVKDFSGTKQWYGGIALAILISTIPVLFWLVPVIRASDSDFIVWLLWNQTAGRVTGNFNAAHIRPFWFYIPLVPIFFMPWFLFPTFWKNISTVKQQYRMHGGLKFLFCWLVPVFVAFSLISGKQPHYLIPLLPGVVLFIAYCLQDIKTKSLTQMTAAVFIVCVCAQMIAAHGFFKKYSLEPLASVVETQPDRDLAFVANYQGEIGFMARREQAVDDIQVEELDKWFVQHPDGWAIIRFKKDEPAIQKYKAIFSSSYRGQNIGIFEK